MFLCWNCAQQGSPSGGPRDEDPPVVLECDPPNYSIRFAKKKINITFDEYIVLENVNQQLVVSPPMEEQPEVKLRKKTIIIEFEEELKPNTTYTFNFGDAIKDLHEGNKLQNYEYVFSTGEVLDSMSVKGTLKYAETLEVPEEPVSIMLYTDLRDSVPLLDIPIYVGRSNDSGVFMVNNLRPDEYKVFALKDGNNNFLFDLPTEEIAFLDSSLILKADFIRQLLGDSLARDSSFMLSADTSLRSSADSTNIPYADSSGIATDSIAETGPDYTAIYIDLLLFQEASEIQYITNNAREDRRKIELIFALPLTDSFAYSTLLQADEREPSYLEHFSKNRDSLTLWIKDSSDYKRDTIALAVDYTVKDTTEKYIIKSDTLLFTFREREKESRGRKTRESGEEEEKLEVQTIRNNGNQDLNRKLSFALDFPLGRLNDTLFFLYHIPDTVELPIPFLVEADSMNPYRATLSASWESASEYRLQALPGAINSIYPISHDTLDIKFKSRDQEFYGQILLTLENVNNRVLVQLLSGKDPEAELIVETDGQYAFPFLHPKKYSFKFIHDLNENGKWDTGDYLKQLQPEPIELLRKEIEVRSNWDHEVKVRLEK